jgi:hypothetical protein
MKAAARTDVEVPDELLAQIGMAARVALLPRIRRNLVLFAPWEAGFLFLSKPGHDLNLQSRFLVNKYGRERDWSSVLVVQNGQTGDGTTGNG